MTITEKYKANYLPGFDCRMTTFRNNLAFYGLNLSNGMILGLSGCLTFIYSNPEKNRIPFYTIAGIIDQTLEGLSSIFDTYITRGQYDIEDKTILSALKDCLNKNILINVAINRPFLEHIRSGKNKSEYVIEPTNVGFHFVTVTEINDNMITFFETDYGKPLTYDVDTFMELWFFDEIHKREVYDPPQKCNGKYYTILPPGINANTNKNAIRFAIDKVVRSFFSEKEHYHHGNSGIEAFFDEMLQWENTKNPGTLIQSIFIIKILEKYLSGGGFGRRIYSSFLAEVASDFQDTSLKPIAMEFRETAKLWSDFISEISGLQVIGQLSQQDVTLFRCILDKYAASLIHAEKQQFELLRTWIDS